MGCQYSRSIVKSPYTYCGNEIPIMTQHHRKDLCMVPVMIHTPEFMIFNAFTTFYIHF